MKLNAAYPALLALLLTLALAGCGREQLSAEGSVIRFQVNTAEISSSLTKYDLPAVDDVPGDFLRKNGNTVRVWGTMDAAVLFDPYLVLTCDGNGSSASWNYAGDPYYWNMTAAYQFRSAFTNGHDSDLGSASAASVTVNYSGGYDLMVAATSLASSDPKSATLYFGHACSAVRFYCVDPTRSSSAATANFNIKSFKLNNVSETGTLTFSNGMAWNPEPPTAEVFTLSTEWPVPSNNDDATAALTPWFFFVPQNLASSNASIEFSFAPAGTEYAGIDQSVDVKYFLKDASTTWEAGKMYTYFIVLDPAAIEFINFSIQPWPSDAVTGTYTVL
jgi:hypothetical protein